MPSDGYVVKAPSEPSASTESGHCHQGGEPGEGWLSNGAWPAVLGPAQSFHFPLFMTMLHLAVIFLFSALSRALVQCSSHRARVVLSWTDYLRRVAPTGTFLRGEPAGGGLLGKP